jgi:hypothetical protein
LLEQKLKRIKNQKHLGRTRSDNGPGICKA